MSKPTIKAMRLLIDQFAIGSGVHTDEGTVPLWGQLVIAGYVKHLAPMGCGHSFEYEITPEGKQARTEQIKYNAQQAITDNDLVCSNCYGWLEFNANVGFDCTKETFEKRTTCCACGWKSKELFRVFPAKPIASESPTPQPKAA